MSSRPDEGDGYPRSTDSPQSPWQNGYADLGPGDLFTAVQVIKALGVYDALASKIVQGSNIAQTFQFVELEACFLLHRGFADQAAE
jgi:hypothetical protein